MKSSAAFDRRFAPLSERLYGYAFALTRDREQAADLFQDCVVRAMSAKDVPDPDRAFRAWLFAIMRNLWIDGVREHQRKSSLHDRMEQDLAHAMPVPLESVIVNQLAVREAFSCLSIEHRDVLALIDIVGFSYEEAAELLSIPRGTVMSRISRARQALFRLLADDRVVAFPRKRGSTRDV